MNRSRALVRRQPVASERDQVIRLKLGPGDDECRDLFAPAFRGETGHRNLRHGRMLLEHHLYLARIDVVPARDDQLLDPTPDGESSIARDLADVARAKPAVDEDLR